MTKVEYTLSFPYGAHFKQNPKLLIYRSFLRMIKKLSCMVSDKRCKDCPLNNECNYYKITGYHFSGYPGIIVNVALFDKKIYRNNELLKVEFYCIGNQNLNSGYIELFFNQYLDQNLVGNPFYVQRYQTNIIEDKVIKGKSLSVNSIIPNKELISIINDMIDYYSGKYDEKLIFHGSKYNVSNTRKVEMINMNQKKYLGITGQYIFDDEFEISSGLVELGIGRYNYLGGGKIAVKN